MLRLSARRLSSLGRRALAGGFDAKALAGCRDYPSIPDIPPSKPSRPAAGIPSMKPSPLRSSHDPTWRFGNDLVRRFSSVNQKEEFDEAALEEEAEKKAGWLLKIIFLITGSLVAFQFFPYMGDNLLQQSIKLLLVKDPLFKRMGASRLTRFAIDDERRMRVAELGGAQELLNMLETAKDDKTRKFALKALVALSHSDAAAKAMHQADAVRIVSSIPNSLEYVEVETYKSCLLKKFGDLKHDLN